MSSLIPPAKLEKINRQMREDALKEAKERVKIRKFATRFSHYQDDPYGFLTEVIGDTYTDDVVKVMESVRDNPITLAKSSNSVGKSHSAARLALWFYLCYRSSQVYVTAAPPLDNLKNILWSELLSVTKDHPKLLNGNKVITLRIEEFNNPQHFIAGVTIPTSGTAEERESRFSGKHAPHLLFIFDEGDAIPPEVYKGAESCMTGGDARMLILFNPKQNRGPVYEKEKKKQGNVVNLSALRHPNVIKGYDVIPGAVTRETTVRRINEWTRPLMDNEGEEELDIFEVPDFLIGTVAKAQSGIAYPPLPAGKRVITEPSFAYMVLGRYPAQSWNQLISEEWINAARSRYDAYLATYGERPPLGVKPKAGLDVAEFGTDYNILYFRYGSYLAPAIRWSGLDPIETGDRALLEIRKRSPQPEIIYVDAIGIGSSVAPYLSRQRDRGTESWRAIPVKYSTRPSPVIQLEHGDFYQRRDQLWWAMREWLRIPENGAMLPPQHQLLEELKTATYGYDKQGGKLSVMSKETFREYIGRSPNYADALSMTFDPTSKAKVKMVGRRR